ncbi:MAG: DUF4038 domain-containing protein [bacterium]|nr:DUF4038 domain-containing protein [bacterium]MCM1374318.1 DUF4038 domain-containing protein [Muribaculum sp.]
MRQYETFELTLRGEEPCESWVHVDVTGEFTLNGRTNVVKGFYCGDGIYKVRFYPAWSGKCIYKVTGVVNASGEEEVLPARSHGMVQAQETHFEYEDGTVFCPFGTTVYALVHQKEELIEQTLATLEQNSFNKVRMCVFPKDYLYNANEPCCYAFEKKADGEWDVDRPCFMFWDMLEKYIDRLGKMGIQVDLILFHPYDRWGFSKMPMEKNLTYLEYLLRRLSAFPNVWWSMANEYDFLWDWSIDDWYTVEEYIAQNDCYHHLLSNHQGFAIYDFSRPAITHCCLQYSDVSAAAGFLEKYKKPVIYDECMYEGNIWMDWGNISGFEMANRFWCLCAVGAYATHGETFLSPDDVLWWAKGGVLKGESAPRIAFLKEILEEAGGALERWKLSDYKPAEEVFDYWASMEAQSKSDNPFVLWRKREREKNQQEVFKTTEYAGKCGEQFFVRYFARTCPGRTFLDIPQSSKYRIEIVDMWEMTRTCVLSGVSGKVEIDLPGKEGIAVLIIRE